jgi:hypothetical protein
VTAYSQTVRNNLNAFSNASVSLWGTELWGGYWGYEPTKPAYSVGKNLATQTMVVSSANASFDVVKYPTPETVTLGDAFAKEYDKLLATETVTLNGDMAEEKITDANGYERVFGDSSDAEDRSLTTFTSAARVDVTWATATGVTTVWA